MSIKGFDNVTGKGQAVFATVHNIGASKTGINSISKFVKKVQTEQTLTNVRFNDDRTLIYLEFPQSGWAKKGDLLRFTSGTLTDIEVDVVGVDDDTGEAIIRNAIVGNTGNEILPAVGHTLWMLVVQSPEVGSDGKLLASVAPTYLNVLGYLRYDYASVNVDDSAWVQVGSIGSACKKLQIFDSGGSAMYLGYGSPGSENFALIINPGGNGMIEMELPAGDIFVKRVASGTVPVGEGELIINFIG
jgi:hypothetical protein